jgi:hypothetical protein
MPLAVGVESARRRETMATKTTVRLLDADLERLIAAFHDDPIAGFVAMWHTLEPRLVTEPELEFAPWDYELTKAQSDALTEAGLEGCRRSGVDTWTIMSLWLNNGPSTAS